MNLFRILIATAIVSLGISGAAFLVKNYDVSAQKSDSGNNLAATLPTEDNNPVQSQPLVEQLPPQDLPNASLGQEDDSLTNELSKSITQSFVKKNPDGPTDINGQKTINMPDPEEIINNLSIGTLKQFNITPKQIVNDSDLNITDLNTEASLNNYVEGVQKIIGDANDLAANLNQQRLAAINALYQESGEAVFNNFLSDIQNIQNIKTNNPLKNLMALSRDYLSNLAILQQETLGKLYKISVPRSILEFHKNLLALFLAKQNILTDAQNLTTDPLMALKAQQVLKTIDAEITDLIQNQLLNLKINP